MRIAIPVEAGSLFPHFGRAKAFFVADVDTETHAITHQGTLSIPENAQCAGHGHHDQGEETCVGHGHGHGQIAQWLRQQGVDLVIAGGMGAPAQQHLARQGIQVLVGAPRMEPAALIKAYLDRTLVTGGGSCGH